MPPATIEVSVRVVDEEVHVAVTDNGIGLPDQDRARLTEPYVTHKPKGTGLGLAIVKKILEDHGGRIALEDRPDGPGAVATLIFPLRAPEASPVAAGSAAAGTVAAGAA